MVIAHRWWASRPGKQANKSDFYAASVHF